MRPKEFTRKNALPPAGNVFKHTITIFALVHDIIRTNVFTKEITMPSDGHVVQSTGTIFNLIQDVIGTNLLTMFYDDWKMNVASRVLTRKNAPHPGQKEIKTLFLSKFHDD
ncbi:hypothetical protein DPMN_164770 [Dreissena polymorpha]|uniref:Uncharacterized protein n=1 Tax=Dreissena polymorpha TaxID=45954 RepID=A0A9D4EZD1_DREPO|nr:hypothetical protein DPMN_164770 [Dreissena polymorpha]